MGVIQIITYISVIVAFVAMAAKALRYMKAPVHFRWELYPVPHERGRADYGGSYLEELDWWTKERHSDIFREIKEMFREIVFLKGVFHHNRRVWTSSFPFHFGLYLTIGWLCLLLLGAILQIADVEISSGASFIGALIHYLTMICGYAGFVLAGIGAFGLLIWRLTDPKQRPYNSPSDYFNLIFFDVVIVVALISHLTMDSEFVAMRGYVQSLITFTSFSSPGAIFSLELIIMSLLIMYIPLTRMSHFVAKYFLYHSVRWNDEPNFKGSKLEKNIMKMLNNRVSWSAPHIQKGQPWSEVVKEMKDDSETD